MHSIAQYKNKISVSNKLARFFWGITNCIFFSPVPRWVPGWHCFFLRIWGARIGLCTRIDPAVRIWAPWNLKIGEHVWIGPRVDLYSVDEIVIGNNSVISQDSCLCTASHDIRDPLFSLITGPINIGEGVWVAARAFIFPGVLIDNSAVIGACAVICKNVEANSIMAGNPARLIGVRVVRDT